MRLVILFCSLCLFSVGHAQNHFDLAKVNLDFGQATAIGDSLGGKTGYLSYGLDLTLPILRKASSTVLVGITTETLKFQGDRLPATDALHELRLKLGVNRKHSERWSGTYLFLPKIASDLQAVGRNDFQCGGLILTKYRRNRFTTYKLGGYYNSELFGLFFVPIFGMYHQKGRIEADLSLPIAATFTYQLLDRFKIGAKFLGMNESFNLNRTTPQYLVKQNNELGPYFELKLNKLVLQAHVGTSVLRNFNVFDQEEQLDYAVSLIQVGEERMVNNQSFKDGLFANLTLVYRIDL